MNNSPVQSDACIFCRIIAGESPAAFVFRDERVVAFRDLHPVAPIHVLIVPVKHIRSLNQLEAGEEAILAELLMKARIVASQEGLSERGYRLVLNTGEGAGQSLFHLHLHLLGGRPMQWPPG